MDSDSNMNDSNLDYTETMRAEFQVIILYEG